MSRAIAKAFNENSIDRDYQRLSNSDLMNFLTSWTHIIRRSNSSRVGTLQASGVEWESREELAAESSDVKNEPHACLRSSTQTRLLEAAGGCSARIGNSLQSSRHTDSAQACGAELGWGID
jgi:hypothetical protein